MNRDHGCSEEELSLAFAILLTVLGKSRSTVHVTKLGGSALMLDEDS